MRLLGGAAVLVVVVAVVAAVAIVLLGGGNGVPATVANSTGNTPTPYSVGGTDGGPSPQLELPASRYLPEVKDMPKGNDVYPNDTFALSSLAFATTAGIFTTTNEGENSAAEWGYQDGYQATFQPRGLTADVAKGQYYTTVNTYLFATDTGAHAAYIAFESKYGTLKGSERLQGVKGLGNESSAWKYESGTVGPTDITAVYHRFIFRRGSMVAVVQTYGGLPYMSIDKARELAIVVDDKALGNRPAPTPTPAPSNGAIVVPTPTPAPSSGTTVAPAR
ncbi:MAG: hypothetical protein HYX53_14595 [Chloroflexi bacterium]|nr:hypothetical protein [Chloroflexota bacterium]